jgi:hypothetical protein
MKRLRMLTEAHIHAMRTPYATPLRPLLPTPANPQIRQWPEPKFRSRNLEIRVRHGFVPPKAAQSAKRTQALLCRSPNIRRIQPRPVTHIPNSFPFPLIHFQVPLSDSFAFTRNLNPMPSHRIQSSRPAEVGFVFSKFKKLRRRAQK